MTVTAAWIWDLCDICSRTLSWFSTIRGLSRWRLLAAEALHPRTTSANKLHFFCTSDTLGAPYQRKAGLLKPLNKYRVVGDIVRCAITFELPERKCRFYVPYDQSTKPGSCWAPVWDRASVLRLQFLSYTSAVYCYCKLPSSSFAHYVSKGNCEPSVLNSLLDADASQQASTSGRQKIINKF